MAEANIPTSPELLPDIRSASLHVMTRRMGHAVFSLFDVPAHDKLHRTVEYTASSWPPQPLQPSLADTSAEVRQVLERQPVRECAPSIEAGRLLLLGGVLVQFSDFTPGLEQNVAVPYGHIARLRDAFATTAQQQGALGFVAQLEIALQHCNGEVLEALWRLFIASRLHARWLDSRVIPDMPLLERQEKLANMLRWRSSIRACKPSTPLQAQDPAGDQYYAWTHALAKVAIRTSSGLPQPVRSVPEAVFHNGTELMHRMVHPFLKQGIKSDHRIAAAYGNAMGRAIADMASPVRVRR